MLDRIPDALKTYQQVLREFPTSKTQVVKARRYGKESSELARSVLGRIGDFVER